MERIVRFEINPYGEGAYIFLSEEGRYYCFDNKAAGYLNIITLYKYRYIDENEGVYLAALISASNLPDGEIIIQAEKNPSDAKWDKIWAKIEYQIYKQAGFPFSLN